MEILSNPPIASGSFVVDVSLPFCRFCCWNHRINHVTAVIDDDVIETDVFYGKKTSRKTWESTTTLWVPAVLGSTPLKKYMEPNNERLEDDFPFQTGDFQVYLFKWW